MSEKACAATLEATLREHIMSVSVPKNEAEWWAHRRIAELEEALEQCRLYIEADEVSHGRTFGAGTVARSALGASKPDGWPLVEQI